MKDRKAGEQMGEFSRKIEKSRLEVEANDRDLEKKKEELRTVE